MIKLFAGFVHKYGKKFVKKTYWRGQKFLDENVIPVI